MDFKAQISNIGMVVILSFWIVGCSSGGNGYDNWDVYPPGSEVTAYDNIPGLVLVRTFDGQDRVLSEGDYLNDQRHGPFTTYDPQSGLIAAITTYYEGLKHGPAFTFDKGRITEKTFYQNDVINGQQLQFDNNGVTAESNYLNGRLEGMVRKYYRGGVIMEESSYANGVLDGLAKWYDQQGNLLFQYLYVDGELVDKDPEVDADTD